MVGREDDLTELERAFERAVAGEAAAVLVEGEAGIGKSRLLRELESVVASRADVHVGWCLDLSAARTPYGPLIGILRSLVTLLGADAAIDAVGAGADALRMLLPELADGIVERERTSPEGLRDAIATLIDAAAERAPQVIIIEDLHWADDSTLTMLSFLLRALGRSRVLLVLSCRSDDVRRGDAVSQFIAEASRARLVERLPLRRLDQVAQRSLAEHLAGRTLSDASFERMMERAEGVPFFIEELACCADAPLPVSLRDLLLTRFDRLSDDAKHVVRVASGAEGTLSHPLLSRLAELNDERLDAAIREAARGGILAVEDERYGFRHALLREAVHADLLPGERSRLHRSYAEALEDSFDESGCIDQAALAHHWNLARDSRRALIASVQAMLQAKRNYAFATAARFGELALEQWEQVSDPESAAGVDRITLLRQLGSILRNAGDNERAITVVDLALSEVDRDAIETTVYARLLRDKAGYFANVGRPGSIELFVEALSVLDGGVDDDELRANTLNGLAGRYMVGGMLHEAIITATEAFEAAERVGDRVQMSVARNIRGTCRTHLGDIEGSLSDFAAAGEFADTSNAELRYRVNYSDALALLGRYHDAVLIAERGFERTRELGVERSSGPVLLQNMMEPLLALGDIDRVEELLARAATGRSRQVFDQYVVSTRVRALAWRGEHEKAEALRRTWLPDMRVTGELERQVWYYAIEMETAVLVARGDWAEALGAVLAMLADDGPSLGHRRRLLLESGWIVAELRARGQDTTAAALAIGREWETMPESLQEERWSDIMHSLLNPEFDRLPLAVEISDQQDLPVIMRGVTRLEYARALVATGDRAEAGRVLSDAAAVASEFGHSRLRREIADFGAASGLQTGKADDALELTAVELTARERQVLDLIAEGLSNKQIGERLFISGKTASVHVSAILRKLGVTTRTAAALLTRTK